MLFLAVFFFAILLLVSLWNYQAKAFLEPLNRDMANVQTISSFLDCTEQRIGTYADFRWEHGDVATFIYETRVQNETAEKLLALIPFAKPEDGRNEYLLASAIRTTQESLSAITEKLCTLLTEGRRAEASDLYFGSIAIRLTYLRTYTQQLIEKALTQSREAYNRSAEQNDQFKPVQFASIIFLFLAGGILLVHLRGLFSSLKALSSQSNDIANGNLDIPDIQHEHDDEIGDMTKAFNTMKHSMKRQVKWLEERSNMEMQLMQKDNEALEMQAMLEREKLQILRSQINPHFLFNTLNVIRICAMDEGAHETQSLLSSLGKLYHYAMGSNTEMVPLSREIQIVVALYDLYKARFADKIEMTWSADPAIDLTETYVPSFILQPLAENTFRHGFGPKEGKGLLEINITIDGEFLSINLKDNGVGIPKDKLDEIKRGLGERNQTSEHIGLYNVSARLKLLLPKSSVIIDSSDKGTTITLMLPYDKTQKKDE